MRSPMPQIAVTGRSPIVAIQSRRVRRAMPPGLANPVAVFACSFVSPMPMAHERRVTSRTRWRIDGASASGSSVRGTDERLVPAPHLDRDGERPQRGHHLGRRGVVRRVVRRRGTRRRGTAAVLWRAASPSARRTPAPRRTRWRRPGGDGSGRRHRRRRRAVRPAPAGAAPRRRPGTDPGRRAGSTSVAPPRWSSWVIGVPRAGHPRHRHSGGCNTRMGSAGGQSGLPPTLSAEALRRRGLRRSTRGRGG